MATDRDFEILLVEDTPTDRLLTLQAFHESSLNEEVHIARNGQEAVDFLFEEEHQAIPTANLPDLILLDLHLPKLSGLEVLDSIKSHQSTRLIPVVVFSSSDLAKDILQSYQRGANSYITKPIDHREFTDMVQKIESYWLSLNQLPSHGNTA